MLFWKRVFKNETKTLNFAGFSSFNPCYSGRGFLRQVEFKRSTVLNTFQSLLFWKRVFKSDSNNENNGGSDGFNPCYSGRGFLRIFTFIERNFINYVSILVILEEGF